MVSTPAHLGPPGSKAAAAIARELSHRAGAKNSVSEPERMQPLTSYTDIPEHYRLLRQTLASPQKSPPPEHERHLRALQTHSTVQSDSTLLNVLPILRGIHFLCGAHAKNEDA